jgi:predicted dithiol-disulfide oxidoreductase (DUF899 family)
MTLEAIVKSHKVVSHEDWLAARRQLLAEEKEFTRLRDRLSRSAGGLLLGVSPRTVSSKRP